MDLQLRHHWAQARERLRQRLQNTRNLNTPKFRRNLAILVVAMIVLPIVAAAAYYWSVDIPTPAQMRANEVTTLYADDGTTEIGRVAPQDSGTIVPLSAVPTPLRDAVLAAEDRDFYRNPGFSMTGFLRAVRDNLLNEPDAGGGSTITQQYVKNAMLSDERTVLRKTRELLIATKMARQWSKDDILAAYLNTIYFGRGAYGIADAAQAYFARPLNELTVAQDAVLAAVIRAPSALSNPKNTAELQDRWNYVLDGMVKMGVLSPVDRAAQLFPELAPPHPAPNSGDTGGPDRLIRTQVLRELAAAGIPDKAVGGLKITTTIDPKAQRAALDAATSTLTDQPPNLRTAVVSIDPKTGGVRAYYGGQNGVGYDFAQAPLQTGSAFKVFGLIAGLESGDSLDTQFSSAPLTVNGITITNSDGESCGTCSLARGLQMSLNTLYYRMELALGPNGSQLVADAAHRAGIPMSIPGVPGVSLSNNDGPPDNGIVLGQYLVRPIDMASAYATIAAQGTFREPHFVAKVVDATGTVLLDRTGDTAGDARIPTYITNQVTQAMLPIAAWSRHHQLADSRPSASKTGTTQLAKTGQNKDAWMVGFTPELSTAVWVGADSAQPIVNSDGATIYGAGLPSDIWKKTMDGALAGTPVTHFDGVSEPAEPAIIVPGPPQNRLFISPGPPPPPPSGWLDRIITPPQGPPPPLFGPGPPGGGSPPPPPNQIIIPPPGPAPPIIRPGQPHL